MLTGKEKLTITSSYIVRKSFGKNALFLKSLTREIIINIINLTHKHESSVL